LIMQGLVKEGHAVYNTTEGVEYDTP
jgi:hypothetical protein